jgi:hypothetical protein
MKMEIMKKLMKETSATIYCIAVVGLVLFVAIGSFIWIPAIIKFINTACHVCQ